MYLNTKFNILKEKIDEDIKTGGALHLTKYPILKGYDVGIDVPISNLSKIKSYFKNLKNNSYPVEICCALEYYCEVLENTKAQLTKSDLWSLHKEKHKEYSLQDVNEFMRKYYNMHLHHNSKEFYLYLDSKYIEEIISSNKPKKINKIFESIIQGLESDYLFTSKSATVLRIEFYKSKFQDYQKKVADFNKSQSQSINTPILNDDLEWSISQIEAYELVKSLIEAKVVKSKSEINIFRALIPLFGFEVDNNTKRQNIQDLKKRSESSIFLNKLQHHLNRWQTNAFNNVKNS